MSLVNDTIVAPASPPQKGAVGIVRVSGPEVKSISQHILGFLPKPRYATFSQFKDHNSQIIDSGLGLYFPGPNSFTGEDVLELQCHGGLAIIQMLIQRVLSLGARRAEPGEFSQRAFLNNKIDLVQAEAIADLINASTKSAVKSAQRSLKGEFSEQINIIQNTLNGIRIFLEASIDFVDEEIDFLSSHDLIARIDKNKKEVESILENAKVGRLLQEGVQVAIAGRPNVGKSSLLNLLAKQDVAIVTDIPGTTRDVLKECVEIDGLLYHFMDTAGIRKEADQVEKIGIERAFCKFNEADLIVLVLDATAPTLIDSTEEELLNRYANKICVLINKTDLLQQKPKLPENLEQAILFSVKEKQGVSDLFGHLKNQVCVPDEGVFCARSRHIKALEQTLLHIKQARTQLIDHGALELAAEELKIAQDYLSKITGKITSDELLGDIFSSFCIGK